VESVQRKFTKRLPELYNYSYVERLKRLELQNLELRRLHLDLIWCYKIVFQCVNVNMSDSFQLNTHWLLEHVATSINCINHHVATIVEQHFFSQRVLNVWNAVPDSVDFASLNKFKQSIFHIDFNDHLACFKC